MLNNVQQAVSAVRKYYSIDRILIVAICVTFLMGLFVLYSANRDVLLVKKQIIKFCVAFVCMFIVARLPPRVYKFWAPWLYGIGLILLLAVLFLGHSSKGGQRWLDLKIFRCQPAEIMRLAVPLLLAKHFEWKMLPPSLGGLVLPILYIVVPVILIALQPDLGTSILVMSSGIMVIFFAGVRWRHIILFCLGGLSTLPVIWGVLHDYQRSRILNFFHPDSNPLSSGYQIIQAKIAIGSGGVYGKGWLHGTQTQLEYLPERATDCIFAVFSEEFGFLGALVLLVLYSVLLLRSLYIAVQAQDTFCRLLVASLTMTFFVYVFVNIGMVCGILPVVGIPLPLISYGGSSLFTVMVMFGIILSIKNNRFLVGK